MNFVGRDTELDLLQREVALALELSAGRSVFVQGTAGTGKSALVREFLARLASERPGVSIARGRCLQSFGSADPYLPFVEALRDLSDESTAGFVQRETLSEMIAELTPFWLSAIPMVGGILSASFTTAWKLGGGATRSDAPPSREALFVQYLELLQGLAREAPLVLLLEDLHWADHSSIALLNHISRGIVSQPVLIIGTLRSDDATRDKHPVVGLIRDLERESIGTGLKLGDMEGETLDGLLSSLIGGNVSEPLLRWLHQTAGGNPLFASELVKLLLQNGGAVQLRGEWCLAEGVAELPVPRSAEAVIETRIEALDADEIKLLQYASVQGNEFDSIVLAGMLEVDELDTIEQLERLERAFQLVTTTGEVDLPDGEIATVFQFRHALVQTVLYRQVMGKRRVLLHRKAGEILERIFGDDTAGIAGKLSRHFHDGRVSERAYRYASVAAENARRVYAHWESEELYRIALAHAPDPAATAALHERLGDVYQTVGYYDEARSSFQASLNLAAPDVRTSLRLRRKLAVVDRLVGSVPAPEILHRLRGLLEESGEIDEERCLLLLELGFLPNAVGVMESTAEAVRIADSLTDASLLARALEQLAVAMIFGGDASGALPHLERGYAVGGGASDLLRTARYHNIRGVAYAKLGQYRKALGAFEEMLAASERLGSSNMVGAACSNLGLQLLILGQYERGEVVLQRAYSIHRHRDRSTIVQSLLSLAKGAYWAGDLEKGLQRYAELLEAAREVEYWTSEAVAAAGQALCLLEMGRVEEARAAADVAGAAIADREQWFEDRELIEILFARLEALEGRATVAVERLNRAAEILENADIFVYTQVRLERTRILSTYDREAARFELDQVAEKTAGTEFALGAAIEALRAEFDGELSPSVRVSG
jgi:tetratricopeptide (TPR) repeat protein